MSPVTAVPARAAATLKPPTVVVSETNLALLSVVVEECDFWVVYPGEDGTRVEILADLLDPEIRTQLEPPRCTYYGDHGEFACPRYADTSDGDDRCAEHGGGGRWP